MRRIKKILVILVAACTLFCMCGCSLKDYFETIDSTLDSYINGTSSSEKTESSNEEPNTSSSETENSSSSGVEDEETETLVTPDNVLDYVALGLEVNKAAVPRFESCTTDSGAIRFYFSVSADLKAELDEDENKRLATLIYPLSYFDRVNTENYSYMDWITTFKATGNTDYALVENAGLSEQTDGSYAMISYLYSLSYARINSKIVAMGVLITTDSDGNETYKYSTYASGNYRTNARSLGYVAAESLNKYALGQESYTAEQIELCKTYVNWSVDMANGLTEPTDDNSTYTVIDYPPSITLNVGGTATVNVFVEQDVSVPVAFKVYHSGIAMVSGDGTITALSAGNTVVAVYVAGVSYVVNIKVTGD